MAQESKTLNIQVKGATRTIQLWNESGTDMLDTYDVLKQISDAWEDMTNAEKSSLAIDLAKKTQMDTFLAILSNFEDAEKAYVTALASEGSAWQENEAYMQSIEALQSKLAAQTQQFVLGDGGLEDLEKSLLNIGVSVMEVVNGFGGLSTVMSVLGATIATVIAPHLLNGITNIGKLCGNTKTLIQLFTEANKNGKTFSSVLKDLGISANVTTIAIRSVVAVIGIAITAYKMYKAHQEELQQEFIATSEEAIAEAKSIEESLSALDASVDSRETLIAAIKTLDESFQDEGQSVDWLKDKYDKLTESIKEASKQELEDAKNAGFAEYQKSQEYLASNKSIDLLDVDLLGTRAGYQQTAINEYGFTTQDFSSVGNAEEYLALLKRIQAAYTDNQTSSEKLNDDIKQLEESIETNKQVVENYEQVLVALGEIESDVSDGTEEQTNIHDELLNTLGYTEERYNEIVDAIEEDEDAFNDFNDALSNNDIDAASAILQKFEAELDDTNSQLETITVTIDESVDALDEIQSAYDTLKSAQDEYNSTGQITTDTLKALNELSPEYLSALELVNGQMILNTQSLSDMFDAEKSNALMNLELAEDLAIVQLAEQTLGTSIDDTNTALSSNTEANNNTASSYDTLTESAIKATAAITAVKSAAYGGDIDESTYLNFLDSVEDIRTQFSAMRDDVSSTKLDFSSKSSSSGSSSSSSTDAYLERFKAEKEALKHQLEMNYITEKEYYDSLAELNEKYFGIATGLHDKYLDTYQENEEEVYKGLKSIYEQVKDYLAEQVEDGYEDAIDALEKEEEKALKSIKKQIKALEDERDDTLDSLQDQINSLEDEKDAVEDYWDNLIEDIEKANEELEQQNKLLELQQALQQAKAQKVMVLSDESGKFELTENESAVASAEQNLSQYEDELSYEQQIAEMEEMKDAQIANIQERIDNLQDYYDYLEEYYENQIDALENYYNTTQEYYDAQIDALEEELKAFRDGQEEYDNLQNAKLASQVMAMDAEADNWNKELANLRDYINQYNAMLAQLGVAGGTADYSYSPSKGASVTVGGEYASGISSVGADELAIVGEDPHKEIVIGSGLNSNGSLISLAKGSGVVNAESANTLAGILNGISSPTPSNNGRTVSTNQTFTFGNITLPNVTDANSFVQELSDKFNNYAIQYSSNRN